MDLYLRKVRHPAATDNYRVVLKLDGDQIEIGSIGVQHGTASATVWKWGIDTVIPMRSADTEGRGADRGDCMRQFKAAWTRFATDEANLTDFLAEKRRGRR
jgi:hypothetical protein